MSRALVAALLLFAAGCRAEAFIPRLPHDRTTGTEILVVGPEGGDPETHYVFDLAKPQAFTFELPTEPRRLEAFVFDLAPDVLDLEPGRDTLRTGSAPRPEDYTAFFAAVSGSDDVSWAEEPDPQWASRLRIPDVDARRCLLRSGCFEAGRCKIPCGVDPMPEPPNLPEPPNVVCPNGWISEEVGRVDDWPDGALPLEVCRPWTVRPSCALGTVPRPGGACVPMAAPCPAAEFPADVAGVDNVFVRAGADGGDGSRDAPFGTLALAIDNAAAPARIVLGAGSHPVQGAVIPDGVDVYGVCPETTRLDGRFAVAPGADVELGAFTVADGGLDVRGTARLTGAVFEASAANAIDVENGAALTFADVDVRGPAVRAVRVRPDATLEGTGFFVTGDTDFVLWAQANARIDLADSAITFVGEEAALVAFSADVTLRRTVLDGAAAFADLSTVVLEDTLFTNTATASLELQRSTTNVTRLYVTDTPRYALIARRSGSLTASDVVLARVATATTTPRAFVSMGLETQVDRLALVDSGVDGVFVANAKVVALRDIVAHRIGTQLVGTALRGDNVESLEITRAFLSSLGGAAVYLSFDMDALVDDVTIRSAGTRDCYNGTLLIRKGTQAMMHRIDARQMFGAGALVDDATVDLTDARFEAIAPSAACDRQSLPHDPGTALHVLGGVATLREFLFLDAEAYGVRVIGAEVFSSRLFASEGRVAGSDVGLEVSIVDPNYGEIVDRVDFSMNDVILIESGPSL